MSGPTADASLSEHGLYVDEINWSSEIDPEALLELECKPKIPKVGESHEAIVITGDSFLANQAFLSIGWGDNGENFKIPPNESPANYGILWVYDWDGNANACVGYCNNTWHINDGSGDIEHLPWESNWNNNSGWNHSNSHDNYKVKHVKPKNFEDKKADNVQGSWDDNNVGRVDDASRYLSRYRTPIFQGIEHCKNHLWWKDRGRRRR